MSNSTSAICTFSCAPMRRDPNHISEITNQLLFGERCRVLNRDGVFWLVVAEYDGYEGWVDGRQFAFLKSTDQNYEVVTDELASIATSESRSLLLPLGAVLPDYKEGDFFLNGEKYHFSGAVRKVRPMEAVGELLAYARRYLAAPYQWGGRTPWGMDCSGLCQLTLRAFGISLLRDSTQQITQGEPIANLSEARPGDLAFFMGLGNHVGIIHGKNEIIHASGSVRIDDLNEVGIWNRQTGENTHQLTGLRRFLQTS